MRNLSKSKIIAYRQCPKRLWLELHKPELRDDSASQAVFAIGYQVGDIARQIYDPEGKGTTIDIESLGHAEALARSAELLAAQGDAPIFEAGVTIEGALAYADVLLPDATSGRFAWRMVEVKSSGSVKNYQRDDLAVQTYIATSSGVPLSSVSLAHIDTSFVYQGDGDYRGLLVEHDLTEESMARGPEVAQWIAGAQSVAAAACEPVISTGPQCSSPFGCAFFAHCHQGQVFPEYPLGSLPRLHHSRRARIEAMGHEDLRDVPDEMLNDTHIRVKECSVSGIPYFDAAGAAADLAPYGFPAYFLDFETIGFTVPIWKGTRPFQQLPFQFSLHILGADGTLDQQSFLDLSGTDPSLECARKLLELCGTAGPVFAYNSPFECRVMKELGARFPELAPQLNAIIARTVDLYPIAKNRYYHPAQQGKWGLKSVLPSLCPDLSYNALHGVQDGSMAQEVYQEAIRPETPPERTQQIHDELSAYCALDTFAMVRIWQVFSGR